MQQLAGEPFIVYGRRWAPAFYDHWTTLCLRAGFIPNVVQEAAEMETVLVLVAAGLGVAILPEGITRRSRSILTIKPFVGEKISSEIGVLTHTNRTTPLLERFVKLSKELGSR